MEFKEFIKTYPNFSDCAIQTFDDRVGEKKGDLARIFHVSTIDRNQLKKLNQSGAGVFFSVNSMIVGKRNKSSVTHLNTWIVESDSLSKELQLELISKAPIKPSCVIESSKSYHIYYFAEDATFDNWERVNRGLREYYSGDVSLCSDTSQVLRLPGTYHNKGEPYKITCLFCEDIKYTENEMLEKFPYTDPIKTKQEIKKTVVTKARNVWELMGMQSNRYMLDRVSRSKLVRGEDITYKPNSDGTDQIYVNGQSTGAWIDRNDYIGSSSKGGPTWIQRCEYYGNKKGDIIKWFTEFCDDLIPKEFDRTMQIREIQNIQEEEEIEIMQKERGEKLRHISYHDKITRGFDELINTDPNKVMKWGWEERDSYLGGIYGGKIYLIGADTGVGKTTFVNQVANNLASAGVTVTRYSLEDRLEDNAKEEIYYATNQYRLKNGKSRLDWITFVNGEYTTEGHKNFNQDILTDIMNSAFQISSKNITEIDKNKEITIDDIVCLMNEECDKGTRVFVIDHLHYFHFENDNSRMDLQIENAMKAINDVSRKRDVAVFIIAHYNSTGGNGQATMSSFKGSTGIKQIANVIIQISRDENIDSTEFKISKMRGPIKRKDIYAEFDLSTYEYTFTKTKEQKEKEKKISFTS